MLLTLGLLAVLLLGFGAWQLGGAAWIYAKARVAQVLLEQAWVTRLTEGEAAPLRDGMLSNVERLHKVASGS